jgi:iron complex outermembrane receptor protein
MQMGRAQSHSPLCTIEIAGHVQDDQTKAPLTGAVIGIKELNIGVSADSSGKFVFPKICPGKYTFICELIGYQNITDTVRIDKHCHLRFAMKQKEHGLVTVIIEVERNKEEISTLKSDKLEGVELDKTRGLSLGEALKDISGMNSIQTGPGVSKPMIHGLYSNRILILNNGVRQEGQQWGNDHAPEVDPFIASEIAVIKGAGSIRYGSDAIGGVILLESKKMPETPGIYGEVNLAGASNNRMGTGSAMLEGAFGKKLKGLSWRIQGTFRQAGNSMAPHYYLDNTGFKEGDFSAAMEYKRNHTDFQLYYSEFSSQIGILLASHIGNANDLYQAINSGQPIQPNSKFTYFIDRPYQTVLHQLFKSNASINYASLGKISVTYAWQIDYRKEFSPDISYNDSIAALNIPELYFKIISHTVDVAWYHPSFAGFSGSLGLNAITQGNVYRGTDFFSVIPNYRNYGAGAYAIEKWSRGKFSVEGGLRYDYLWLQVYMYNQNLIYVNPIHQYDNLTTSLGATYRLNPHISFYANYGSAWRAPGPNELYGMGVHVSAASFERGDSTLGVEKSYNFTGSAIYTFQDRLKVELGLYNNTIDNFIYLRPDLKPITLISGAYPSFTYVQANVIFRGIDLDFKWRVFKGLYFISKTTLIRAFNYSITDYLIFTPADRFQNTCRYEFKTIKNLQKPYIGFSNLYVAHQNRVPPNSDFAPPPSSYTLFNAEIGSTLYWIKRPIEFSFMVNNIANIAYRDYLDRLRYFADEPGRNFVVRIKMPLFADKTTKDQREGHSTE